MPTDKFAKFDSAGVQVPLHTSFSTADDSSFVRLEIGGMRASMLHWFQNKYCPEIQQAVSAGMEQAIKEFPLDNSVAEVARKALRDIVQNSVTAAIKEIEPELQELVKAEVAKVLETKKQEMVSAAVSSFFSKMSRGY